MGAFPWKSSREGSRRTTDPFTGVEFDIEYVGMHKSILRPSYSLRFSIPCKECTAVALSLSIFEGRNPDRFGQWRTHKSFNEVLQPTGCQHRPKQPRSQLQKRRCFEEKYSLGQRAVQNRNKTGNERMSKETNV